MHALRGRLLCGWMLACALGTIAGAASAPPPSTSGGTVLDRYLSGLESLRTDFSQTVTDAHGAQTDAGAGTLLVQRPDRFRWDYEPHANTAAPAAENATGQLLVADGANVWFFDRELAQVTVKPIDAALSSTPIMLLSGSPEQLRSSFDISAAGAHDGLDWVSVKPRGSEGDFSNAQLGFKADRLSRMLIHDNLGQTVQLEFLHSERNVPLPAASFEFAPPAGVDVIGTPQPRGASHGPS